MTQADSLLEKLWDKKREFCDCDSVDGCVPAQIASAFEEIMRQHLADQADVAEARERLASSDFLGVEESERLVAETESRYREIAAPPSTDGNSDG